MKPYRFGPVKEQPQKRGLLGECVRVLQRLSPPRRWHLAVLVVTATLCGMVVVVFHVSRAASYMTDDPAACVNCHIMAPQYASWQHSSHARVATCNDCHVPQDSVWRKYGFKAKDGARHSFMFTFRMEPQVIRIHEAGAAVVQENCIRCHSNLFETTSVKLAHGGGRACVECHREVPHGRVGSLASSPDAQVPRPPPTKLPDWLSTLPTSPDSNSRYSPPTGKTP